MRSALAITLGACLVVVGSQTAAQEPPLNPSSPGTPTSVVARAPDAPEFELVAGYASMQDTAARDGIPGGLFASFERNYNGWLAFVVEWSVSGEKTHHWALLDDFVDPRTGELIVIAPAIDTSWRTAALLVGPTGSFRHQHRVALFGRMLAGVASVTTKSAIVPAHQPGSGVGYESEPEGSPALAVQPGAGLDLMVNKRIGVRLAADYRRLFGVGTASGAAASQVWLTAGVMVAFGTR